MVGRELAAPIVVLVYYCILHVWAMERARDVRSKGYNVM